MHEFTRHVKEKGWTNKKISRRWGITERQMTSIAAKPKKRDWDALAGIPDRSQYPG